MERLLNKRQNMANGLCQYGVNKGIVPLLDLSERKMKP